jgi:nucleoside-diphosphate-sugar epimerase
MVLDRQKATRLLGWEPRVSLEEGLREEWQWLQEHPAAWDTYRI